MEKIQCLAKTARDSVQTIEQLLNRYTNECEYNLIKRITPSSAASLLPESSNQLTNQSPKINPSTSILLSSSTVTAISSIAAFASSRIRAPVRSGLRTRSKARVVSGLGLGSIVLVGEAEIMKKKKLKKINVRPR